MATPEESLNYEATIFGTPTRFGNMAGRMPMFLNQTSGLGERSSPRASAA